MTPQTQAIVQECQNQEESCLYTSTSLFIWLRRARWYNRILNFIQIVVGVAGSAAALKQYPIFAAFAALLSGVLPSIYQKLNLSQHIKEIESHAGNFKNLQDRFRQAATIISLDDNPDTLKAEFVSLMRSLEDLRAKPLTVPEWCFLEAQEKIKAGHYNFDSETKGKH
jgi:hypothetical protein